MSKHLSVPANSLNFIRVYLQAVNGMLQATDRELDVLEAFIKYDSVYAATSGARRYVAEELDMKSVAVLNNFVKALKDKEIIVPHGEITNRYLYHPLLRDISSEDHIVIRFELQSGS